MRILHSKKLIFISKPRCGSTSIRRFLDSKLEAEDEFSDYGEDGSILHPHMSAPAVHHYLGEKGYDVSVYTTFTITRHPVQMLWSYFNYFKPDLNSNYNYSPAYEASSMCTFEHWLNNGKVGIGLWRQFCPQDIVDSNFSPLSLEAHSLDQQKNNHIDKVFKLEELNYCEEWLQTVFNSQTKFPQTNASYSTDIPRVSKATITRLEKQFPLESQMYDLYSY